MESLGSLGLTGIWLFLCSVDSPLKAGAIAHLFSSLIHEQVGPLPPRQPRGPGTWHLLVDIRIHKGFLHCQAPK